MSANKSSFEFKNKCGNSINIIFGSFKYRCIIGSQGSNAIEELLDDTFPITLPCPNTKVLASRLMELPILGVLPSSISAMPKSLTITNFNQAKRQTREKQTKKANKKVSGKYICIFVKTF
jgi:hypothetical protein